MRIIHNVVITMILFSFGLVSSAHAEVSWQVHKTWEVTESPIDVAHSNDGKWTFLLTAEGKVLVYSAAGKLEGTIPVDSSITAIDISRKGDLLFLISRDKKRVEAITVEFIKDINIIGSPFMGAGDAPVVIVEFSDFQCPGCGKLATLLEQVLELYPDRVKLVFKNFPLDFHQYAKPAARAALAAGEQGKFWEYHDMLFKYGSRLNSQRLTEIAVELGLDMKKFIQDMTSISIDARVKQDINDGKGAGVSGTPTTFINGKRLKERTLASFRKVIDGELEKESTQ